MDDDIDLTIASVDAVLATRTSATDSAGVYNKLAVFSMLWVTTIANKNGQIANEKLLYFIFFYDVDNESSDIIDAYLYLLQFTWWLTGQSFTNISMYKTTSFLWFI